MTKLRLPKPAAVNVVSRHLYFGSVYTKEQMQAFAEKAIKAEREYCSCIDCVMESCAKQTEKQKIIVLSCTAYKARGQA